MIYDIQYLFLKLQMTSLAKFHGFADFSPAKTKNILHLFLTPFL